LDCDRVAAAGDLTALFYANVPTLRDPGCVHGIVFRDITAARFRSSRS
jgi:hypothetical protein